MQVQVTLGKYSCPFAKWHPPDGRVFRRFAYDTETTAIDDDRPSLIPAYVLGAASDGTRGVFITREDVPAFFAAHRDASFICHNAAFDLKVTDLLLKPGADIYEAVDNNRVWDTMVLKRLYSLATAGHTARGEAGLDDCVAAHLGIALPKDVKDAEGNDVRTRFGRFLGRPLSEIPDEYLAYLGRDALAT